MTEDEKQALRNDPYARQGGYAQALHERRQRESQKKQAEIAAWNRFVDLLSGTGVGRAVPGKSIE